MQFAVYPHLEVEECSIFQMSLLRVLTKELRSVLDILREKHPTNQPPFPDTIIPTIDCDNFSPSIFQGLNENAIRKAALHTNGAAGPSGADAAAWRCWCTCYGKNSVTLCLASFACRICSNYVDPSCLTVFIACRLIPP